MVAFPNGIAPAVKAYKFGIRKTRTNKPVFDSVFIVQPVESIDRVTENRVFESSAAETTAAEIVGSTYDTVMSTYRAELQELQDQRFELKSAADLKAFEVDNFNGEIRILPYSRIIVFAIYAKNLQNFFGSRSFQVTTNNIHTCCRSKHY